MDYVFYFDRIDRDANNYFKILLDSITESQVVWLDDNTICERIQAIYYDSANPRIEMIVYPVDYIGIFPNQEQLDMFDSGCIRCTRYKEDVVSLSRRKRGAYKTKYANLYVQNMIKREKFHVEYNYRSTQRVHR